MQDLKIFKNEEFGEVRTMVIENEPWFVGKDVAEILGYSNSSKAVINHVEDEDKQFFMLNLADSQIGNVSKGQTKTAFINESGLYSLILSSKLPQAKKFKKWVTGEVLPAIRKHGAYMTDQTIEKALTSPDFLIDLATKLKQEQEARKALENKVEKDKPKVLFADSVTNSHTSILVGELAKLLKQNGVGIGQNRLFKWLRDNKYLISRKGTDYNMPTQYSMDLELFEIKEGTYINSDGSTRITKTPKVTGKGQVYFVNKFLERIA